MLDQMCFAMTGRTCRYDDRRLVRFSSARQLLDDSLDCPAHGIRLSKNVLVETLSQLVAKANPVLAAQWQRVGGRIRDGRRMNVWSLLGPCGMPPAQSTHTLYAF